MKTRLVIVTEIIAPYRIPVFNALSENGEIDLHVIFLSETDRTLRKWRIYKDEIRFSYEVLPSWRVRRGNQTFLLNYGLTKALRQFAPDSIICGGYNYPASWIAANWAKSHKVPFLLWTESTASDHRGGHAVIEYLKAKFLKYCSGFVVPGCSSRDYLRRLKIPDHMIFTAPNAVDNDFFAKIACATKQNEFLYRETHGLPSRFILYAGRLVPAKGVFDLLGAYGKLAADIRAQVGLIFAGDGPAEKELRQQSKNISPGYVELLGFSHREDLAALYGLAEALIFPTHSDPWGLVVNEAMACALPIIASKVAGCTADLVDDGWNGLVVPPHDVGRLTEAMDALLRGGDLRSAMSANSADRIRGYSPDACARGLAVAALATNEKDSHLLGEHIE